MKEFVQRLFILVVTILFIYALVSFHSFVGLYVICFALPAVIIFFFLLKAGEIHLKPDIKFLNRELVTGMAGVSVFGIVAGATGILP